MTKGIFCLIAQATMAARKIQGVPRGVSSAGVSRTVIARFAIGNTPHLTKYSDGAELFRRVSHSVRWARLGTRGGFNQIRSLRRLVTTERRSLRHIARFI